MNNQVTRTANRTNNSERRLKGADRRKAEQATRFPLIVSSGVRVLYDRRNNPNRRVTMEVEELMISEEQFLEVFSKLKTANR